VNPLPLVCLITPGHVASTPRLVKSADALAEAGYRVRVVAGAPYPPADPLDAEIFSKAKWDYTQVNGRGGAAVFARKLMRKAARALVLRPGRGTLGMAARAHLSESVHLGAVAARVPARLFIGHCIGGLFAAAFAARARGQSYGFDIEDYHDAETQEAIADPAERRARHILQSSLLPGCRPLTCASPLIGRKYEESYRVVARTVLNVFPLSQAPAAPAPWAPPSEKRPARFYWFSQTIGHGRGLEKAIAVIGRMRTPAELHLRGFVDAGYLAQLQSVARQAGLRGPITFLPPGPPNEMARLAATADMGLAVEEAVPLNKDICLPNKDFIYLLAGIPQLLSNTSAHVALGRELGDAAIVSDLTRMDETAARLDQFFSDPDRVRRARSFAWELAQTRFCWDREKEILLDSVRGALAQPA
jgi:hypothetical protein